jgi:hypothetical protein
MRLFAGRSIGPVWLGVSEPFHPARLFLEHGSGGYQARPWFPLFGFAALGVALYFCWWAQH